MLGTVVRRMMRWAHARPGLMLILVAALVFSGCEGQAAAAPSPTPQPVGITVTDTTPPPGVNVPGAHWIKIHGAGGVAKSEQVAAVFRPPGQGPFPLVIELHGGPGLSDVDVAWAARLAAAGFVAVAGCWKPSAGPPNTIQFYELTVTLIDCPRLLASDVDLIAALIAVGRKQPGVRTDAVGLYGFSAGGVAALDIVGERHDIRAAVLDSPGGGAFPAPSTVNVPVLVLAATADEYADFKVMKNYVEALQGARKDVEWHYYEGGRHGLVADPANKDDAIHRIIDFLTRRLNAGT
jgi:dienelactone hydrolase